MLAKTQSQPTSQGDYVKLDDLIKHQSSVTNLDIVIQDLHDILCAYYKVARKRFVDNVCMQGADYHLIAGPDTPLHNNTPASPGYRQLEDPYVQFRALPKFSHQPLSAA